MNDEFYKNFLKSQIVRVHSYDDKLNRIERDEFLVDQWPWTESSTRELVEAHIDDMFDFDLVISHETDPYYGGCSESTKVEIVCCTAHTENMRYSLWSTASDDEWSLKKFITKVTS